jgi:anti-sigma factor RsiW
MPCPDELTLDLWLAGALPSDEAATVTQHVATCSTCSAARQAIQDLGSQLHASLALADEELAYLSNLQLASAWQASPSSASAWGWIALIGVVAGFLAWLFVAPTAVAAIVLADQVGLSSVALHAVAVFVFDLGRTLLEIIASPALGFSQPLLALLALALLFWPRHLIPQRSTPS